MKKKIYENLFIICTVMIILIISIYSMYNIKYNTKINDEKYMWSLKYKGLKGAVDFTVDQYNNIYIAFKDKITYISDKGETSDILYDKGYSIYSIDLKDELLYISEGSRLLTYNLNSKELLEKIKGIPDFGDYKEKILKINNNKLYLAIGAATNSGVVGMDNTWTREYEKGFDITPYTLTLSGEEFGKDHSGAFAQINTKNLKGDKVASKEIGTSSILVYDLKNEKLETFAYGIRNSKGLDFFSDGTLVSSIGGMEDRGLRPIKDDVDYIYTIKKGMWYGWPDFTGGDPVDSPRFNGLDGKVKFVLSIHPDINPPAPIFVNKNLSAISALAVDKNGEVGEKDDIFFYDNKDKTLTRLNKHGALKIEMNFSKENEIGILKFCNGKLLMLDKSLCNIISFENKNNKVVYNNKIIYGLLFLIGISILVVVKLFYDSLKNKLKGKR